MDAWVLRLGVEAPGAFKQTVGQQGIFFEVNPLRSGTGACHELQGHFAHLDDGRHVRQGSYYSSRSEVETTAAALRKTPRPVVLMIQGSLLGMTRAFDFEIRRRAVVEAARISPRLFPYSLFWCNDFVDSSTAVLTRLFDEAVAQAGPRGPALETAIERATHGIGRAFWRDIKRAADTATRRNDPSDTDRIGDAAHLLDRFLGIEGVDLHLVIEGAGAVLFGRYLAARGAGLDALAPALEETFSRIASLALITPTLEFDDFAGPYRQLIAHLGARDRARIKPGSSDGTRRKTAGRAFLWTPSEALEGKLCVGVYSNSILDLVLYGFEGAARDRRFIGMSAERSGLKNRAADHPWLRDLHPCTIAQPDASRQIYSQDDLTLDPGFQRGILKDILRIQRRINSERTR